jgi:RimJ/RimL family protein N-acetyltransferase
MRLRGDGLVGFVQATVFPDQSAGIAYVLSSARWGQGIASEAVVAMCDELRAHYDVARFSAVLKRENARSVRLLARLGFLLAANERAREGRLEAGEILMLRDGDTTFAPNRQAGSRRK